MAKQSGGNTAQRVEALVRPTVEGMGLRLWDVVFEKEGPDWYLRILIDRDGTMDTDTCAEVSHALDPILDEADPIDQSYYLEVGSPGLGRKLTRPEHYEALKGQKVRAKLIRPNADGVRELSGILTGREGSTVTLETENGAAVIAEIAPRKNVFVRPPVANLDVLFLVASTTQPTPSTLVLDKLSAIAVDKGVQPVIVCTKADLGEVEFLRSAYERSTLPFIAIRYDSGEGLDEVRQWISGRLCAFCGNSGVGKSTLLNTLLPQAERETSAISQKLGRGRHTTREVTIFEAFGGRIADTPGFASLEANRAGFIPKENLEHAFPEFGPYLGQCQFTGCSHRTEKGCAIRAALAEGKLSRTRYDSYCAMYEEVKDVKDWQRRGM